MRAGLYLLGIGIVLAIGSAGCAQRSAANQTARGTGQVVTGSYLPQNIQKSGPVTNGKNDLRIIDKSEMDRSGGADVNQSLRQLGVR